MGNFVSTSDAAFKPSDAFFIFDAAKNGSIDIVRLFLKKSKWLAYATDADESTPWHVAAAEGYDAVVRVLIDAARVNKTSEGSLLKLINRKNAKGQTPLMLACGRGHVTCARLLLESGAALLLTDATGRSALHHAALYPGVDRKDNDCVGLFLEYMQRRLFLERHKLETHATIIRRHADAPDMYGRTPLHCAAWSGNVRAVHTLWMVGADICSQTVADCFDSELPCNRGSTALHFAAIRGHQQVVILLLAAWHRMVTRPESPLPRPAYAKALMRELQEAAKRRVWCTVGGEREQEAEKAPAQDQREGDHAAVQGTSSVGVSERGSELALPCGEVDGLKELHVETESGRGQVADAAGTSGDIGAEVQTGGPATKHQRDAALPEDGDPSAEAIDVRTPEAASARGLELASGTGNDGGDGASNSSAKSVDVPTIQRVDFPPPPLPPPARIDPRLIVDGYGLSPYDYARKNKKEQRGLMLVELLDAATDFGAEDTDGSGSEDGLVECDVREASSGQDRGRRGSRAYGRGRGSENDDADSDVAAAGSLLLWDGVELVQDIAADPDSFFMWQHSARFLQSHLEEDGKEGQANAKEEHGGRSTSTIPSRFSVATEVIPDCFLCPMTCKVLRDPVVAADGVTYERDAIERHLRHVSTSPVTKQYLPSKQLYANNALKSAIAQWSSGLLRPGGAGDGARSGDDRLGMGTGLWGRP